jgi:hypothetical protein
MSWFGDLIATVKGQRAVDFVVTGALPLGSGTATTEELGADQCYVELRIASLRIPRSRKFTSKLYGVIHAFTTLSRIAAKDVQFANVRAPDNLANIDPDNAYKAVMVDKVVMGPAAWRGGNLDIEIGLFSVVTSDMAGPFVDLMTDLAQVASASFATAAAPFVPTIKKGVQLLAGKVGSASLEVGISRTLDKPATGFYAVIGADKAGYDMSGLSVDANDYRLMRSGKPVEDVAYLVYRLSTSKQRPDFGNIPELAQGYSDLLAKLRDGREAPARDALAAFTRLALTSPDLIEADADALVDKASKLVTRLFPDGKTAKADDDGALPATLGEIGLYA